ncbi:AAA family ATPase [Acidianus sp. HS-5]|uniref:ATP-dependent nuclease n=1 Tax=Acidianus sp. HS-5 TaxID=2886040 RepID=UPI001F2A9E1E|nr:AAA family ATPase [Acidianus sp. HS-5]BDC17464.1 hypothetical protein HS5_03540 [Acidianus sp. HS-5]
MEVAVYCGKIYSWTNEVCNHSGYTVLDYNSVKDWVNSHGEGDYLIFGTDVMPYSLYDYPKRPISETLIFKFMERGGTVIWAGDIPFYYVDKEGKKEEIFKNANPFPFIPQNFEHRPVSNTSENTIVGEMLEYEHKDSWRPVGIHPLLIPISKVSENSYSTWIYKHGKGKFVRVYDSPYVNAKYVLSLPERLSKLGIGIRIRNFRRFSDFKMVLPKIKIGVIIGKNNVGKTSILEALAMLGNNADKIKKFRGKITDGFSETELFLNYEYYKSKFSDSKVENDLIANVILIYSHLTDEVPEVSSSLLKKVTDLLSYFDPNIFYVYNSPSGIRVLFKDKTDISINELGYGYRSLINFVISYLVYQPKIILIDDLEGFAFHPELLKAFYDFLLKLDAELILITTQSSDVYYYLASKNSDDVRFILINENYEVLTSEEALNIAEYEDLRYRVLKGSGGSH